MLVILAIFHIDLNLHALGLTHELIRSCPQDSSLEGFYQDLSKDSRLR